MQASPAVAAVRPPASTPGTLKSYYWLRVGSDEIEDALPFSNRADAMAAFKEDNDHRVRIGNQPLVGYLHKATSIDEIVEDVDYVLTYGVRGGVRLEAA